jgi:hypothetical protein
MSSCLKEWQDILINIDHRELLSFPGWEDGDEMGVELNA